MKKNPKTKTTSNKTETFQVFATFSGLRKDQADDIEQRLAEVIHGASEDYASNLVNVHVDKTTTTDVRPKAK